MTETSPACPLCQKRETGLFLKLPDRFNPGGELYNIYACDNCSFVFLHPLYAEEEAAGYYAEADYDPFLEIEGARSLIQDIYSRLKPWALNWKARLISKFCPQPGILLDVGAGTGAFLNTMVNRNWIVQGVEKNPQAAEYARLKLELKIFHGDLADSDIDSAIFDVVTFWHSLEHIHRLKENLKCSADLIKPAGFLFIALPNLRSIDARTYREKWVAWDAPRHLWHFDPGVLGNLLAQYGFNLRRIVPMPLDPFYNSLLSEGTIDTGAKFLRYAFRLPAVAASSFVMGLLNPRLGSSVVYCYQKQ